MKLFAAFVVHEWLTQLRSLRFRVLAAAYVLVALAPAAATFALRARSKALLGPATYAGSVAVIAPFLTALLSLVIAVDAVTRERDEGSLAVTGLASLSNARFVLSRWGALLSLLLPLAALPFLGAAALAAADGRVPFRAAPFLAPLALHVVPLAVAASALALGLGTIAGGTVSAAVLLALLFALAFGPANALLARFHFQLRGPVEWLSGESLSYRAAGIRWGWLGGASEGAFDAPAATSVLFWRAAPVLGLAAFALAVSAMFVGRARRDLRPFRVSPAHPLRGTVGLLNKLREEYSPDPRPAAADLLLAALGLAALVSLFGLAVARGLAFDRAALARLSAERSGLPGPSPVGVVPLSVEVRARLDSEGAVRSEVTMRLKNGGDTPATHLAFALNPHLSVEAFREGRPLAVTRALDRLALALAPPLAPGGEVGLSFRVAGRPARLRFPFEREERSFALSFERCMKARFAVELFDLSRSEVQRAATARRVRLEATDLAPVPRYTTWALTPPPTVMGQPGLEVREEEVRPASLLSIELEAPRGLLLADSCGNLGDGRGRLAGSCRAPLFDLLVAGGPLASLEGVAGPRALVCLPAHLAQARRHLPAFADAARHAARAWEGLDPFGSSVVMEDAPPFSTDPFDGMQAWWWNGMGNGIVTRGRLVLVGEAHFARLTPLDPEAIAADSVASALTARRPIAPSEQRLMRELFRQAALARLGRGPKRGAVVEREGAVTEPLLRATGWGAYRSRLPAVLHAVTRRCREGGFVAGVERFLSKGGPGTSRELLEEIGRASGIDLSSVHRDFFDGDALPALTLEGVRFRRAGSGWEVTGSVRNEGTGEALCPVVLTTELDPVRAEVALGPRAGAPFLVRSAAKPRALLLDPGRECYRFARVGLVETVEAREER